MPATDAMTGNDILLYVDVGPEGSPDLQPVAYQTDYTHETTRDGIDVSHKGSDHAVTLPGRMTGTLTCSLRVLKPGTVSSTHDILQNAYENRLDIVVQEVSTFPGANPDGSEDAIKEASAIILTYTKNGPDNDAATFDVEISLNEKFQVIQ